MTREEEFFNFDKVIEIERRKIRAETIKPFEDLYNKHICIDYDYPTMPMLMDFYNCFKEVLRKVKEQK